MSFDISDNFCFSCDWALIFSAFEAGFSMSPWKNTVSRVRVTTADSVRWPNELAAAATGRGRSLAVTVVVGVLCDAQSEREVFSATQITSDTSGNLAMSAR